MTAEERLRQQRAEQFRYRLARAKLVKAQREREARRESCAERATIPASFNPWSC